MAAHITAKAGGEIPTETSGMLKMVDGFDRSGEAYDTKPYARAGTYANRFGDEPGKHIPKVGAYAEAGVGEVRAEGSIFDAAAKGPNASAGAEASLVSLAAMAKAEVGSASASAGPLKAKVGLAVDTGAIISPTQVEAKVLGTGVSFGRKMGVSLFGTGFEFKLW